MRKLFFIIALIFSTIGFSQNKAVKPGEKFVYAASYNMSGLMTQLAQVTMETETIKTSKKTLLHLSCEATTYSKWDGFFKIRDLYESYVDPTTLKPNLYKRDIFEGKYTKKEKYIFKNGIVESTMSKKGGAPVNKTFNVGTSTQDAVSTIYQLRNVDFSKFKVGQTKTFTVIFDEKEMTASAKYMGKETISAGNLGTKTCYKISIAAKTQALKGTDKNIIWLTADNARVPAKISFSIPVGTGQLTLTNASGL
jgi:hypothetical protein